MKSLRCNREDFTRRSKEGDGHTHTETRTPQESRKTGETRDHTATEPVMKGGCVKKAEIIKSRHLQLLCSEAKRTLLD